MTNSQTTFCPHNKSSDEIANVGCPLQNTILTLPPVSTKSLSIFSQLNYLGMKYLGKWWLFQYIGSIYPGVIAHFSEGTFFEKLFFGQKTGFHAVPATKSRTLYEYFEKIGINEFAKKHGGICTFRMGRAQAFYQTSNVPLAKDKWLAPSQDRSTGIFGDFLGTLPLDSKLRKKKRAIMESVLGNWSFLTDHENEFESNIARLLGNYEDKEIDLERFCQDIAADNGSLFSGAFDYKVKPLSRYFDEFKSVTLEYFELASELISGRAQDAEEKFARLGSFVKSVLKDNYSSIQSAPDSNIIKRYFQIWGIPFTLEAIDELDNAYLREFATIMINTFETTSLSLSWAISYIENNPSIKQHILDEIQENNPKKCSYINLVVLEAIRLGGSNPTVMMRIATQKFELKIGKNKIVVMPGTQFWLNRRDANQDSSLFRNPSQFDPDNIKNIIRSKDEDVKSIVSKNRHEINSFNVINTEDSPRKCPARLYTVYTQSLIIHALYRDFEVKLKNNDTELNPSSAMPKPMSFGIIQINKRSTRHV